MQSILFAQIKSYYLTGYGCPVKRYSDEMLDAFAAKGILTKQEVQVLKEEKRRGDGQL